MTKSVEMRKTLAAMIEECQSLVNDGKVEDAKNKKSEIDSYRALITVQEALESDETQVIKNDIGKLPDDKVKDAANAVRAALKKGLRQNLTEAENALLLPTPTAVNGESGEGYLLPEDVRTTVTKLVRQYGSIRELFGYMKGISLKGSFAIENFDTVTELVDLDESKDGADIDDISFSNVSYSLKAKAAFLSISNLLLKYSDEDLLAYVSTIFSRKKAFTENKMLISATKENKTPVAVVGYDGIKTVVNTKLDPAAASMCVYLTNQTGFDILDHEKDANGRPILQPDPTQPTVMLLKGHPIKYVSDSLLPNVTEGAVTGSPIFIGDLKDGVYFVDGEVDALAFDSSVGFMRNKTVGRIITLIDAVQVDKSDKCYVYGLLSALTADSSATTGA